MRASLVRYEKVTDELGNTIEIKVWQIPKTADKPHDTNIHSRILSMGRESFAMTTLKAKETTGILKKR